MLNRDNVLPKGGSDGTRHHALIGSAISSGYTIGSIHQEGFEPLCIADRNILTEAKIAHRSLILPWRSVSLSLPNRIVEIKIDVPRLRVPHPDTRYRTPGYSTLECHFRFVRVGIDPRP